jgi:hypothetical protein
MKTTLAILAAIPLLASCSSPRTPPVVAIAPHEAISLAEARLKGIKAERVSAGDSIDTVVVFAISPENKIIRAKNDDIVTIRDHRYRVILVPRHMILALKPIGPGYVVDDGKSALEPSANLQLRVEWPNKPGGR